MNTPLPPIPAEDREHILRHTNALWPVLAGKRLFITGGTGFYGKWLLESIAAANDELDARVHATILSRNPDRFTSDLPHLASRPEFAWLTGDTAGFAFPEGPFDYVFHFATASAAEVDAGGTAILMQTLRGTERVLHFASTRGARRLLFASSGAVYGRQPADLGHIPEDYRGAPDPTDPASAYGEMKRLCELLCVKSGVDCVISRGFAFVGPYLPLTDKFAVGGFIRDALAGGPIRINGDGTPLRSYLYAADLAIWLLTLLVRGKPSTPYNLGSDHAIALADLAATILYASGDHVPIEIGQPHMNRGAVRYIPAIERARAELGLTPRIPLTSALGKTIKWARKLGSVESGLRQPDRNSAAKPAAA
ncbi:MAG: NAD-dependent epimerase/dehydratase family protein [Sulfuritalea sp.]|nr:NAD-dependent epimerase/dehydratase family protein [Sulfuritalea sp.]